MSNEIILILSLIMTYGSVLVFYKFLGKSGLYAWTSIATITANIEVMILVDAFGMEQTLGNILFASTFLVTDILSEIFDKESANKAVKIGILSNIAFVMITQSWFLYMPNANDAMMPAIQSVFTNTPRLMFVSIGVYAVAQVLDVWVYHKIWSKTTEKLGDSKKGLWLRNNLSTLFSQLVNSILFTFGAFAGMYDTQTLMAILLSSYLIYVVTSIVDTPVVYLARKMSVKKSDTVGGNATTV